MSKCTKIIAVDFDGTLVENHHPEIGPPIWEVVARVRAEQDKGTKVILWTCRRDATLAAAVQACGRMGLLPFTAVNENLPEIISAFGGDTRKIFAHEYWDDRAIRMPDRCCDECGFKLHSQRLGKLPDCNTCGQKNNCPHCPIAGEWVRVNCHLWEARK